MAVFWASIATLVALLHLPAVANGQCSGSTPNYVNFTLRFDWWPEEVNWTLTDDDGNIGLIGGGSYNDSLEVVNQDTCISDGCYDLLITDDYGDGLWYYGWFTLSLNGYDITFGKQDVDDYFAVLSFCTDAFLSGSFNDSMEDSIAITMETYDYSSEIYVYSSDYTKLYYNQYEFPEHWWNASSVTDTIYLSSDFDGCIKVEMINGYADSYNGYLELSYSLDGGLTSEASYQRDWNDESDISIIICNDNSTFAPTPAPTFGPSDVVFNVGDDGRFKFTRYVGCEDSYYSGSDCQASQVIEVDGLCENPRLTMRVYESDYDWNFEQAFIYLNNEYIGNCEPLNDACSNKFRKCNRTDELELDLQGYFNVTDETNKIEVGLECENVDYCGLYFYNDTDIDDEYPGLEFDDSTYYWWYHEFNCVGKVEITCDVWDNYTTSMPTSAPTPAREIDTKYNFTLTVQLGSDEETFIWWLYDTFLDDIIYQDVGSKYKDNEQISATFEIGYGCYYLVFNQSDTDSGTQDSFSWYRVELNGQTITHDVHGLDVNGSYYWYYGYTGLFWFCTDMFDFSQEPEHTLTLNTYKFDGLIEFYDYLNWNSAWFSIVSNTGADNMDEVVSTKWNVNFGCYVAVFYSKINYWEGVGFWYELIANKNNVTVISRYESEDDDWSYVYFCTNVTQDEYYIGDTYSDIDCSDSEDGDIGFGFSIKFDSWPEEVDWTLTLSSEDDDDGTVAMSGSGDYQDDYEEEFHGVCIESGCYDFQITDSWGDGMYHQWGDYGWFRMYVNNSEITFGKQGVTNYDQSMYFCTRLFVSDDDDPMHSLVIRSISNDTEYTISDCTNTIVYRNEMFTPGFLYYFEDEFTGSVAELGVVEGCYYISADDNFTVSANGDGVSVAIDEVDSYGAVISYQAFICLGDATCRDTDSSSIANTASTDSTDSGSGSSSGTSSGGAGAVIATVIVIIVLIVIAVLVIVKIRNNKQKAQVDRTASVDMLPNGQEEDINPYVGVVPTGTSGETAGRWDMQEIGDGDLPNNDDADGDDNAGDTQDGGDGGDDGGDGDAVAGDGDFAETR